MEKENPVVEELRGLLFDYELSDQDLHAIAKSADYNMDKCITATMKTRTDVGNTSSNLLIINESYAFYM